MEQLLGLSMSQAEATELEQSWSTFVYGSDNR
jgi:hypothetical protein